MPARRSKPRPSTNAIIQESSMPATLTYPGVYIEEVPSGVRTITGVATSITAFVGRAKKIYGAST